MIKKGFKNSYLSYNDPNKSNILFVKNETGVVPQLDEQSSLVTGSYINFNFSVNSPFFISQKQELTGEQELSSVAKVETSTKLNYNEISYLDFLKDKNEFTLLNYYILAAKDINTVFELEKFVTNNFRINDNLFNKTEYLKYVADYVRTYFQTVGVAANGTPYLIPQNQWQPSIGQQFVNKQKNIYFDSNEIKIENGFANLFPCYNKLTFYKEKSGEFYEILRKTYFNLNLFSSILEENSLPTTKFNFYNSSNNLTIRDIKTYNFQDWLDNLFATEPTNSVEYFNFTDSSKILYLGLKNNKVVQQVRDNAYLFDVMKTALKGKVNYLVEKFGRTFQDVINNKESYVEPLLIKIEKFLPNSKTVFQTYYFENNSEQLLEFFDTQVKPETSYNYKFYYYVLALGTSYSYEPMQQETNKIKVSNLKNVPYIFEIPLQEGSQTGEGTLENKTEPILLPPATPTLLPIPYKDIKNQIKLVIQKNLDEYMEVPIRLTDNDKKSFDDLQTINNRIDPTKPIKFSSYYVPTTFEGSENLVKNDKYLTTRYEIFKLDVEPFSYNDFYGKLYKTIEGDTFIETLEFNKKYYYIIREISVFRTDIPEADVKQYFSNPSRVLQIEIVNNSGVYYPIIKTHEFKQDSGQSKAKDFKKYLFVEPSYAQTLFNSSIGTVSANTFTTLGVEKSNIWNKNYKLRLTSKQTGRKIDINFKFVFSNQQEQNNQIPQNTVSSPPANTNASTATTPTTNATTTAATSQQTQQAQQSQANTSLSGGFTNRGFTVPKAPKINLTENINLPRDIVNNLPEIPDITNVSPTYTDPTKTRR